MDSVYGELLTDDQYFLLYLIMGTYFAPDLKQERPHKSALQRHAEGLPPYTVDELAGSDIDTSVIASVYYYVLRKAEPSVVVRLPWLLQFVHGDLPTPMRGSAAPRPQFNYLFRPEFHRLVHCKNRGGTIENIVFVNNPTIYYIEPEDIERFKRLTGLEDFLLDRDSAMSHIWVSDKVLYDITVQEEKTEDILQHNHVLGSALHNATPTSDSFRISSSTNPTPVDDLGPGMIFLPSRPSREEWSNLVATIKSGFALTGSAARGQIGPVLGLMDIGESEDSYLFRVSLPGVRRDEKDFSCEVENDGSVLIKGVTSTGEKTVEKYSQVFEMQSQNLCPPGPFSLSFKLPGPVDPQQFHGTFATDAIFEGIAWKVRRKKI
ncbi:Increased DNA methylation 2 [Forsythia ovata]|uniref:Increased DNA methylation 2 n=1 Tax=Forsythia ovata TaxID=205694 RepID=A0ABD1Q069_9LAMI